MRWSQLKKLTEELFDSKLDLKIHCTAYRGEDGAKIGRYWIVLDGEMIWEEPKQISKQLRAGIPNSVATNITIILRDYVETPKEELLSKTFPSDQWGLVDILLAADRRIGKRRFESVFNRSGSLVAKMILDRRLSLE